MSSRWQAPRRARQTLRFFRLAAVLIAQGGVMITLGAGRAAWGAPPTAGEATRARHRMVDEDVEGAGITNTRVLDSVRRTPRHEFMPADQRHLAYYDMAVPIGEGQTISPPFIVAYMTEQLEPQPTDKVLEIGTGSGYQAAILSPLVADVYTIEIVEVLGKRAASVLKRLKYKNVHTRIGDGYLGWEEHAPFDKIIVTCSPEKIPQPLIDQLAEGGRMVIPVGERYQQTLYLYKKVDGKLEAEPLEPTMFVPMTGTAEDQREVLPDQTKPEIINGGFEQDMLIAGKPDGWYYVRQAELKSDAETPKGKHYLTMSNDTPGRFSQALQAFGVDGRRVRELEITVLVRAEDAQQGRSDDERARLVISYFDSNRAPCGKQQLGPWSGSFDWIKKRKHVPVPKSARLAILAIGLLGGTGEISFDEVHLQASQVDPEPSDADSLPGADPGRARQDAAAKRTGPKKARPKKASS